MDITIQSNLRSAKSRRLTLNLGTQTHIILPKNQGTKNLCQMIDPKDMDKFAQIELTGSLSGEQTILDPIITSKKSIP